MTIILIETDNQYVKPPKPPLLAAAPLASALAGIALAALALTACGSAPAEAGPGSKLEVVASFYPLQFAVQQIGGDHIAVTSLTKPGVEPHDVELTPRDVASVSKATLVVYERGLQGAVDQAVESQGGDRGLDVALSANLDLATAGGARDPHFWLDPQRYSDVAKAISERLSRVDPDNKADYQKNAKAFEDRLAALSAEFTTALATCERRDIVTSHAAFGYLSKRFGMSQVAINGLSPDQEPKAADIAEVSNYARAHGVTTIYAETLVSPAIAKAVATEAGATLATLDPIEGLTDQSRGKDYFQVMRSNLTTLQAGQGCT